MTNFNASANANGIANNNIVMEAPEMNPNYNLNPPQASSAINEELIQHPVNAPAIAQSQLQPNAAPTDYQQPFSNPLYQAPTGLDSTVASMIQHPNTPEQPIMSPYPNSPQGNLPIHPLVNPSDQSNVKPNNPSQENNLNDLENLTLIPITEDKFESINPSGWYALAKGKKGRKFKRKFANYRIVSGRRVIYVDKNGEKYKYIALKLCNEDNRTIEVSLPYVGWSSKLMKAIEQENEGFITASDKFPNAAAIHKRFCEEVFKKISDEGKVITQFIYIDWGWGGAFG